ncbi:MAG: HEAT repeat domain-containing protein [archaeon]|nr:HEAT repeat domain-containing protein [archaeon]
MLQHAVISALKFPAEKNEKALEALVSFSKSDFILSKIKVAEALSFLIEKGNKKCIDHLVSLAKENISYVREETNKFIGKLIKDYRIDLEVIKGRLLNPEISEAIRNDAIFGLGIAATGREDALNTLKELISDRKLLIRKAATKAIGESVKENPDALFGAFDFLRDLVLDKEEKEYIRMNAIEGLGIAMASKPKEVLDIIERLTKKRN